MTAIVNEELASRIAAIEARLPRKTVGKKPDGPSLAECNAKYFEVAAALKSERNDAAALAKKAIDEVLGGRRRNVARQQKNLAPIAAEMSAQVNKKGSANG